MSIDTLRLQGVRWNNYGKDLQKVKVECDIINLISYYLINFNFFFNLFGYSVQMLQFKKHKFFS